MALSAATFGAAETYLPLLLQGLWQSSPIEAGLILTVGSIGWSFTSAGIARYADYPRRLSTWGTVLLFLGLVGITLLLKFQGPLWGIYLSWFISGVGMGMVVPTYNTLAMDQSDKYPQGVATGSLLLSMTWGFALGAPLAGIFAQYGFQEGFNPRMVGLGVLSQSSSDALRMGGLLALGTALVLIVLTLFFARRMPRSRA
ncbi:MAG: MFS transporter [bacterium]|nr:MFS transporter [bacterium]